MKDFLNGKAGLAKTFWFGVFFFNAAMRIVARILNLAYLRVADDQVALIDAINLGVLFIQTIWLALMLRALFLATFRHAPPGLGRKIGGTAGILVALFGFVYSAHATVASIWPSTPVPPFFLEIEMRQYSRVLPQDLGDGITLEQAHVVDGALTYVARADFSVQEVDEDQLREIFSLSDPQTQALCRDMAGYMRGGLEAVMYEYLYTDGTLTVGFTRDECLGFIDGGGLGAGVNK